MSKCTTTKSSVAINPLVAAIEAEIDVPILGCFFSSAEEQIAQPRSMDEDACFD